MDGILKDIPGGLNIGELHEFLEDPVSDPTVRQDEKSRAATTAEDIKQLRDCIEKTIMKHVEHRLARLSKQADTRQATITEREVAKSHKGINRKFDKILVMNASHAKEDDH